MIPCHLFFLLPGKQKFLAQFTDEQVKAQALQVWNQFDNWSWLMVVGAAVITFLAVWVYYGPFNNAKKGRHYHPKWWALFYVLTLLIVFAGSMGACVGFIETHLNSRLLIPYYLEASLSNTIYSLVLFFLLSWIWCSFLHTNAYRLLKK